MVALSRQRAAFVGITSQHAAGLIRTLRAAGAEVIVIERSENDTTPSSNISVVCDMSEAGIAAAVERIGPVDILVTTPPALVEMPTGTDAATLSAAMRDGVDPAFLWTAAIGAAMRDRRSGVIVHVTGPSGLGGWPGWEAAGTAMAAVHNMVQSFAAGFAPSGVRINALVPGVTLKQAELISAQRRKSLGDVVQRIPMGRFLPEDALGHALLYLVHPSSSYVSGEILTIDGGWAMWGRLHAVAS